MLMCTLRGDLSGIRRSPGPNSHITLVSGPRPLTESRLDMEMARCLILSCGGSPLCETGLFWRVVPQHELNTEGLVPEFKRLGSVMS